MNKRSKIALFSLLALIAAFGLMFAGCENPVQEVEGTVGLKQNSVPAPVSISVTESSANVVIVYEAVDDAAGHNFYLRIPNSKVAQTMTLYSAISTSISGNIDRYWFLENTRSVYKQPSCLTAQVWIALQR